MKKPILFISSALITFIALYFLLKKANHESNFKELSINYVLTDSIAKDTTKTEIFFTDTDSVFKIATSDKIKKEIKSFPLNSKTKENLMNLCQSQKKLDEKDSLIASIIIKDSMKHKKFYKIEDARKFDNEFKELIK